MIIRNTFLVGLVMMSILAFGQRSRQGNCTMKDYSCHKNSLFHDVSANFQGFNYNSIRFEHILKCETTAFPAINFGVTYLTFNQQKGYGVPVEISYIMGRYALLFEMGAGLSYLAINETKSDSGYVTSNINYLAGTGRLGARYQNSQGGWFVRLGYTPHFSILGHNDVPSIANKKKYMHMLGFSLGWTF